MPVLARGSQACSTAGRVLNEARFIHIQAF